MSFEFKEKSFLITKCDRLNRKITTGFNSSKPSNQTVIIVFCDDFVSEICES
jgi:hypothetical protein